MQQELPLDNNRHHYHYLPAFPESFALISRSEEAGTAIIFVHGFGGDACGTWSNFHQLIDDLDSFNTWFATADLFFLQYRSVWERIDSSANRLLAFIDAVIPEPMEQHFSVTISDIILEEQIEAITLSVFPSTRRYNQVILVGHSEGGVVIRKTILDAVRDTRKSRPNLLEARIALFAPALFGYCPSGFLGTLSTFPGVGQVVNALLSATPAYQDLKNTGGLLTPLQEATEELAGRSAHSALRASILWSREDLVVTPGMDGKYSDDVRDYVESSSHTGICKPRVDYTDPISLIVSLEEIFP